MSKVGDPSSKYAYDYTGELLEADVNRNREEMEKLYEDFKKFMSDRKIDPRKIRPLFLRYVQEFF